MENERKPLMSNSTLRRIREEKGWSQQQVATLLGTNAFTVCRWERGSAFPSPHYRQKLCELFGKSLNELGLLPTPMQHISHAENSPLERPLHPRLAMQATPSLLETGLPLLPLYWMVPMSRNSFFTGRETLLQEMHTQLSASRGRALMLYGLGGMGKTQTVLEYVYRYAQYYTAVFWIRAETAESISMSFLEIAEHLVLTSHQARDQADRVTSVQRWLAQHQDWLLIWDNVGEIELLSRVLPTIPRGYMLFTSRLQNLGTLATSVELLPMTLDEGTLLLLHRARLIDPATQRELFDNFKLASPREYAAAQTLVIQLGGLPLALDQVGAYLEETFCSLADYLQLYRIHSAALLGRRGRAVYHLEPITTTWSRAFEKIEQANGAAADLLRLCMFLHPDAIPEEIFSEAGVFPGERLVSLASNPLILHEAISILYIHSFLKRDIEKRIFSIHCLIPVVLREEMSEQERIQWHQSVSRHLNALFPATTPIHWNQCERLLPHMLSCAAFISDQANDQALSQNLQKAADYLQERSQSEQAEAWYQRSLHIIEQTLGPEHPLVALLLYGLANLYLKQEKYEQAEMVQRRAFQVQQQPDQHHPDVAKGLVSPYEKQDPIRPKQQRRQKGVLPITRENPDQASLYSKVITVRGTADQVAYTRKVSMREVTFTCAVCYRTVTQLHYPSGRIRYCSDSCKMVRKAQMHQERVRKQREKRQMARERLEQAQ